MKTTVISMALMMALTTQAAPKGARPAAASGHERAYLTESLRKGLPGNSTAGITRAEQLELITNVDGPKQVTTVRGIGFFDYMDQIYVNNFEDKASHLVEKDNKVYIFNPISQLLTNSYMVGERKDDKLIVTLPQLVYSDTEGGQLYTYYINRMEKRIDQNGDEWMFVDEKNKTITYDLVGDEWVMEQPAEEMMLGLTDDLGVWSGYGDEEIVISPFNEVAQTCPENLPRLKWALSQSNEGRWVDVVFDNNDVWVKGFFRAMPDAWIKGEKKGDVVSFPSIQYMGIYSDTHCWYMAAYEVEEPDPNSPGSTVTMTYFDDARDFAWDAENEVLKAEGMSVLNQGCQYGMVWERSINTKICSQKDITDFKPLNPEIVQVTQWEPERGDQGMYFILPQINANGEILDTSHMYYNIFMDGELYPLTAGDMGEFGHEPYQDIPYGFEDEWDVYIMGEAERSVFWYRKDFDRVGVQQYYKTDDGKVFASDIVYKDNPSGVESVIAGKEIKSEAWFDLTGVRVAAPAEGIYLHRIEYTDGTVRTVKVTR